MRRRHPKTSIWSLYPQMASGNYVAHGLLQEADSLIGLSFGMRCTPAQDVCVPDPVNYELAQYIEAILAERTLPEFLQHEIDNHIHGKYNVELDVTYPKGPHKRYLDTYEVLRQIRIRMNEQGLNKPILVAHVNHIPRVDAVARRLGMETIVLPGLPRVWDRQSSQLWTRHFIFWWFRESIAIVVYKLKGLL